MTVASWSGAHYAGHKPPDDMVKVLNNNTMKDAEHTKREETYLCYRQSAPYQLGITNSELQSPPDCTKPT